MRRRPAPPPSAQQMIREYLGRVSVAATKVLPKGDRLLFVGRTRAAIEAKVGPLASAEADAVLNALTSMGEPEELAKRERERLYSARRRGAAAAPPALWKPSKESRRGSAPPAARQPGPPRARRPRPWPNRGLTGSVEPPPADAVPQAPGPEPVPVVPRQADPPEALPPPATTSPAPASPQPASPDEAAPAGPGQAEAPAGEAPPAAETPAVGEPVVGEPAVEVPAAALPVPDPAVLEPGPVEPGPVEPGTVEAGGPGPAVLEPGAADPGSPAPADLEPGGAGPGGPGPDVPGPDPAGPDAPGPRGSEPGWMRPVRRAPAEEGTPASIVPGMSPSSEPEEPTGIKRRAPAGWRSPVSAALAEAWALARKHPLEAVAVVLLGLGGLILPFPFWLIGGIVALRSRRWDARDKWIALAGPPLVTFAVLLIRAGTSPGNFFSAFYQAARHDVGLSIRAGCVVCAAYLIWRLRRGPRLRTLPPWQRPR